MPFDHGHGDGGGGGEPSPGHDPKLLEVIGEAAHTTTVINAHQNDACVSCCVDEAIHSLVALGLRGRVASLGRAVERDPGINFGASRDALFRRMVQMLLGEAVACAKLAQAPYPPDTLPPSFDDEVGALAGEMYDLLMGRLQ